MPAADVDLWLNVKAKDETKGLFSRIGSKLRALNAQSDSSDKWAKLEVGKQVATFSALAIAALNPFKTEYAALFSQAALEVQGFGQELRTARDAAEEMNVTLETANSLDSSYDQLFKSITMVKAGSTELAEEFKKLNIDAEKLGSQTQIKQIETVVTQLGRITDETERARVAQRLLGSGMEDVMKINRQLLTETANAYAEEQANIDGALSYIQERSKATEDRIDRLKDSALAKTTLAFGPLRMAVRETYADWLQSSLDAGEGASLAANMATAAFKGLFLFMDRVAKEKAVIGNFFENIATRLQMAGRKLNPLDGIDWAESERLALESMEASQKNLVNRLDEITNNGLKANFDKRLRQSEADLERMRKGSEGGFTPAGTTDDSVDREEEAELERRRRADEKAIESAIKAQEKKEKLMQQGFARMRELTAQHAEETKNKMIRQTTELEELQKLKAFVSSPVGSPDDVIRKQGEVCRALEMAGEETISCMEQVSNRIEELEKNRANQRLQVGSQALNNASSVASAFAAIADAEIEADNARLDSKLENLSKEKAALTDKVNSSTKLSQQEARVAQAKMQQIIDSENRIEAQREANVERSRKAAKKIAVLQGLVATASAYAAAVQAGANGAFAGPIGFFAQYGTVLAAGLSAVANIKSACAAIGGGGEGGGAVGGGGASGGGGGAASGSGGGINNNSLLDRFEEREESKPALNLTIFESELYGPDALERLVRSLDLYEINTNRV